MKEALKLTEIVEIFRESNYEWQKVYNGNGIIYLLKGAEGKILMDIIDSSGKAINLEF